MAATTRNPEAPAPAMVTGSQLVTITRWQARAYEQAIAASALDDPAPPAGWNPTGRQGAPVGCDLVLATPRSLSALIGWQLAHSDRDLTGEIMRAHFLTVRDVAMEFCTAVGAEPEVRLGHCFDSVGQSWLHHHVLVDTLALADEPDEPPSGVWVPLDQALVARMAERMVSGYHLLLRQAVSPLIGELGPGWGTPAPDGSCGLWGLSPEAAASISRPARPLGEITACQHEYDLEDK
jgi:hypothetical protein